MRIFIRNRLLLNFSFAVRFCGSVRMASAKNACKFTFSVWIFPDFMGSVQVLMSKQGAQTPPAQTQKRWLPWQETLKPYVLQPETISSEQMYYFDVKMVVIHDCYPKVRSAS